MAEMKQLMPASVSTVIAGRLLALVPPAAFAAYRSDHPGEFPNSTERRIALVDIERHRGRPVPVEELLAADRAEDANRQRYRWHHANRTRKASAHANA